MNNNPKKAHKAAAHIKKGHRFHQQGKLEKAKAEFKKTLQLQADNFDGLQCLGAVYLQENNYPEAIRYLTSAYALDSTVPGLLCNLGLAYRYNNDNVNSTQCFERAINIDPLFGAAHFNLALQQISANNYPAALQTLNNAERCRPGHFATLEKTAYVLESLNQFPEANKYYQHALQIEPDNTRLLFAYGKTLQSDRRYLDAVDVYKKILDIEVDNNEVRSKLADLLESINQPAEGQQHAESVLAIEPQHKLASLVMARLERRQKKFTDAKRRLSTLTAEKISESTDIDAALQTELGIILDRLDEHTEAFTAFSQANKIMEQLPVANSINRQNAFDAINAYDDYYSSKPKENPSLRKIDDGLPSPIFLVGFPRSGTTLTEQILASNTNFFTGDELTTLNDIALSLSSILGREVDYPHSLGTLDSTDIHTLRQYYWEKTRASLGSDILQGTFVDKMPLNIIHLGLVEKIFPDAKIIVALRDPRDVCLSCYMQLFQLNESMIQFLNMDTTVNYYSAVMKLWLRYREHTHLQWIESRYEDIVVDVNTSTKRLNEFLGTTTEKDGESFHQQASKRIISTPSYQDVGTPIYQRAKGRWENYHSYIEEPFEKLTYYLQAFGYTQ